MANNITQIAKVSVRRGNLDELPYALDEGEFGLALDTLDLFIGAPNSDKIKHRINDKVFPYGNLRVLTELSEAMEIAKYKYEGNTPMNAFYPIILKGNNSNAIISSNVIVEINGVKVEADKQYTIEEFCQIINSKKIPNIGCYVLNDLFTIVCTTNSLKIKNISGNFLQLVGLALDGVSEIGESAKDLTETTIQDVLDEYLTIKHYLVKGDSTTNDVNNINNALLGIYGYSNLPEYLRTIYFPAGGYLVEDSINIPSNARLIGEGINRTVIFDNDKIKDNLVTFLSKNYSPFDNHNDDRVENVIIENFTFKANYALKLLNIIGGKDITFRNCSFNGNNSQSQYLVYINSVSDDIITHITFDNCEFNNSGYGIYNNSNGNVKHISIINCRFNNIKNEAIYLNSIAPYLISNTFISNCCFNNCSVMANSVIYNGIQTENSIINNNQFDEELLTFETKPLPYIDESNSLRTDIFNATTDNRKVYTFNYPTPEWKYINSLISNQGEYILKAIVDNDTNNESTIVDYLYIKPATEINDKIEIYSSKQFTDLSINGGLYGNVIIGKSGISFPIWENVYNYKVNDYIINNEKIYKCIKEHISSNKEEILDTTKWSMVKDLEKTYIIMSKNLDLNGNKITNETSGDNLDIIFKTNKNGVLTIEDELNNYNDRIDNNKNAIATVGYLKKYTTSRVIKKEIDMYDYINSNDNWNIFEIFIADSNVYSNNIHLKNIIISVEKAFKKYDFKNMLEWQPDVGYFIGDSVRLGATYYSCIKDNADETFKSENWIEIDKNGINPESLQLYGYYSDEYSNETKTFIPLNTVKLYDIENLYPEENTDNTGYVYKFEFNRNINIADYRFMLNITDINQNNLATNLQPSGKLYITIEFNVD